MTDDFCDKAFLNLPIIGYHHSPLSQKFGVPRQPNLVDIRSHIEFIAPFDNPDAFVGIEQYSHLWIVWQFHHNKPQSHFRPQVRPPRFGGNDKVGVFATRSMYRPSELGLSVVALDRVEICQNRVKLHIKGADMIDGTPIVDVKPYLPFADSITHAQGLDKPKSKPSRYSPDAHAQAKQLTAQGKLTDGDLSVIAELIAQDPRPAYRQAETDSVFGMRFGAVDVDFLMDKTGAMVIVGLRSIY